MPGPRFYVLLLVATLALDAGCSLVAGYRSPAEETGAACSNFLDDDFDGALDCEDPDCDGASCIEEGARACADARDNDGDGLVDGADSRCWPLHPPQIERCATVRGSLLTPPVDTDALVWRGVARATPDPRVGGGTVFAPEGGTMRIAPVESATGALEGTVVSLEVRVDRGVETQVLLLPAGFFGDGTMGGTFPTYVSLSLGASIGLSTDESMGSHISAPFVTPEWVGVELVISDGNVHARLQLGTGVAMLVPIPLPSGMTDPVALDVAVVAEIAGADVPMLSRLEIARDDLHRCGRDELVPEMRLRGFELPLAFARGGVDGTIRCGISVANGGGGSWRAEGDGDWMAGAEDLVPSFDLDISGAALAWDPGARSFVGLLARGLGVPITRFTRVESSDCITWTLSGLSLPDAVGDESAAGFGISYAVEADGTHVLRMLTVRKREAALITMRSVDGDPEGFVVDPTSPRPLGPEIDGALYAGQTLVVEPVGPQDLVVLASTRSAVLAFVERGTSGRFVALPAPLLESSGEPGSFDRSTIYGPPHLLPLSEPTAGEPFTARIFYGGIGDCSECVAGGSASFVASPGSP